MAYGKIKYVNDVNAKRIGHESKNINYCGFGARIDHDALRLLARLIARRHIEIYRSRTCPNEGGHPALNNDEELDEDIS